jgi:hypothetical protein
VADVDSADPEKRKDRSDKKQREGAIRPRRRVARPIDYAFAVSDSQMRILRVSGIRNRPSTKHIAGTAIG